MNWRQNLRAIFNRFIVKAHATVEVRPMGVACQLACTYCYQEPMREAGNIHAGKWDPDAVKAELLRVGKDFNIFGGEAFLNPKSRIEDLWAFGLEHFGKNGVQTNGELIDDEWIELMLKYKVGLGISIDGPGELNGLRIPRKNKTLEGALESTQKIMDNIVKCVKAGIRPGIIITLHRENASKERLPRLLNFMSWLESIGVYQGNIHVLEVNPTMPDQDKHVLTQEENAYAFVQIARYLEDHPNQRWNPFAEMKDILRANDSKATCFWKSCDPFDTQAVYGIEGDGALSNCGRTNKEGIDWYKANQRAYGRYISFYYTPDELGGCQGCRFWMVCGGSCPGESEKGDFRNKTQNCRTQKSILGFYEERLQEEGITPITLSSRRAEIENVLLGMMARGDEPLTLERALRIANHQRQQRANQPLAQNGGVPEDAKVVEVRPYSDAKGE